MAGSALREGSTTASAPADGRAMSRLGATPLRWGVICFSMIGLAASAASPISPLRSLSGEPGQGWTDVAWSAELGGWVVAGRSGLLVVPPAPGAPRALQGAGARLLAPARIGAGPGGLLVFDQELKEVVTLTREGGSAGPAVRLAQFGGPPFGCLQWNGTAWIVAGRLRRPGDGSSAPLLEIQARQRGSLAFLGGTGLPAEEKDTLRSLIEYGDCASGPLGVTVVSFWVVPRLVLVGPTGEEQGSIPLPIPPARSVAASFDGRPPRSPEDYDSAFRGKTVPFAVDWTGESPSVLLVTLGGGRGALRWVTLGPSGQVRHSVALDLESRDGRDFFAAAVSRGDADDRLLVLEAPYSGPEARGRRTLHEFRIRREERPR